MSTLTIEFYGVDAVVDFIDVPDDKSVGFVGYVEITRVIINDENWYDKGAVSNLLTAGAVYVIRRKIEALISTSHLTTEAAGLYREELGA